MSKTSLKITVIDNDKTLTDSLAKKIQKEWYEVEVFNTIGAYYKNDSDLYIVDIWMEVLSFDFIKKLRSETDKPIMVFSCYTNYEYVDRAMSSWADVYLSKLNTPKVLMVKIKALLNMCERVNKNNLLIK